MTNIEKEEWITLKFNIKPTENIVYMTSSIGGKSFPKNNNHWDLKNLEKIVIKDIIDSCVDDIEFLNYTYKKGDFTEIATKGCPTCNIAFSPNRCTYCHNHPEYTFVAGEIYNYTIDILFTIKNKSNINSTNIKNINIDKLTNLLHENLPRFGKYIDSDSIKVITEDYRNKNTNDIYLEYNDAFSRGSSDNEYFYKGLRIHKFIKGDKVTIRITPKNSKDYYNGFTNFTQSKRNQDLLDIFRNCNICDFDIDYFIKLCEYVYQKGCVANYNAKKPKYNKKHDFTGKTFGDLANELQMQFTDKTIDSFNSLYSKVTYQTTYKYDDTFRRSESLKNYLCRKNDRIKEAFIYNEDSDVLLICLSGIIFLTTMEMLAEDCYITTRELYEIINNR